MLADVQRLDVPPPTDERRRREFYLHDVEEFRDALDLVAGLCASASHVAAFAMGGLACLEYITRKAGAEHSTDLTAFRNKFHLFGGLNWRTGGAENKDFFDAWVRSLPLGSTVILFDTGRVGNAAGQLLKWMSALRKSSNGLPDRLTVHIIVLGERSRSNGKDHWQRDFVKPSLSLIRDVYRVSDVITEDALRLAGYEKLKGHGVQLKPIWVADHLIFVRDDGTKTAIASASVGSAFVSELLANFSHLSRAVDTFPTDQLVTSPRWPRIALVALVFGLGFLLGCRLTMHGKPER